MTDMASAGRGICHSEQTVSDGINGAIQTIVRIPQSKITIPPAVCRVSPDEMPMTDLTGDLLF